MFMYTSVSKLLLYGWFSVGLLYGIHLLLPYLEKLSQL
jgi:hypothetical protein